MRNRGLLIINLGSPDSHEVGDVKRFLSEFLMDEEVIDSPYFIRWPLVHWMIVPRRKESSAHAYETIFTERGSPLKFLTKDFTESLRHLLNQKADGKFNLVESAMRYGAPSIDEKVALLKEQGCDEIFAVPMYPQFAKSSTRTALTSLQKAALKHKISNVNVIADFFLEPAYISSFSRAINEEIASFKPDHLLLSYHGLPESHVQEFAPHTCFKSPDCCESLHEGNRLCYRAQCFASSRAIRKEMPESVSMSTSFQSRLGRQEWIKPYTDLEISKLRDRGVKRLLVACPAFVADCLETLEEISIRLRDEFLKLGGEDLRLVPSLNAREYWVSSFGDFVLDESKFKNLDSILKDMK